MSDSPIETTTPAEARDWRDRPQFTATHRAQAVCLREVQRLSDEIAKELRARHKSGELPALVVSQAPGRLMVQLGPVALTVAWLRSPLDVIADGELMVAVWEGAVVQGTRNIPERAPGRSVASARMLREETFAVAAEDEASWRWRSASDGVEDCTTSELVQRCITRLLEAHAERATAA